MKKSDIRYVLCIVFAAATSVAYCSVRWFKITMYRYYPLERAWHWGKQGGPSQAWYSMQTFAYLCGIAATVLVYLLLKAFGSKMGELESRDVKWLGRAGALLLAICMAYIMFFEFGHWGIL